MKKYISIQLDLHSIRAEINKYNKIDFNCFQPEIFSEIDKPKISIIITVFNQENYILKIYFSILKQSLKDIEIIFLDDYSTDNSSSIIDYLMKRDKRIRYIKNTKNKGQFYSRNKGILKSRGEYIIIIDPDDLLLNDILMLN